MTYERFETINAHQPLPPLARVVFALAVTVLKWEERRRTRRSLERLSDFHLKDIGITRAQAGRELSKPIWHD